MFKIIVSVIIEIIGSFIMTYSEPYYYVGLIFVLSGLIPFVYLMKQREDETEKQIKQERAQKSQKQNLSINKENL